MKPDLRTRPRSRQVAGTSEMDGATLVLTPQSSFDCTSIADFRNAYEERLEAAASLPVDLSRVSRLDLASLGMILVLKGSAEPRSVVVTGAKRTARIILAVADIETHPDHDDRRPPHISSPRSSGSPTLR